MKKYDLICVGTALVDSIIRGFDPVPVSASGYRAESGTLSVGGEAVNASITAAKLGLRTGILCALGQDAAGSIVTGALRQYGVDTGLIVPSPMTPVSTLFVREDGSRKSVTNQAHRYRFHPEQHLSVLEYTRAVILGSLFRAPFDDPGIIHAVVSAAKQAGALVVADTKLPNFTVLTPTDIRDSLPLIDYITPNEDEARHFTGKDDPEEMAAVLTDLGVRNVVIKLGARGCFLKTEKGSCRLPAEKIRAVDATGAGDCFGAGFVSELLRGAPPEQALRFANVCGALCASAVGAGSGLVSREQVVEFMASSGCPE